MNISGANNPNQQALDLCSKDVIHFSHLTP